MTKEQLATVLNGRQYRNEISNDEINIARDSGLIVAFGASDDLLEFRGAVNEELGAHTGITAYLFKYKGQWDVMGEEAWDERKEQVTYFFLSEDINPHKIQATWAPILDGINYSWSVTSTASYAHFDIMYDDEFYCRGIVIDTKNL